MLDKKLQSIIDDNKSGSRELLDKLNVYLAQQTPAQIKKLTASLKGQFKEFTTIQEYLTELEQSLKRDKLKTFFESQISKKQIMYEQIFSNLPVHIKKAKNIVTISNSKTFLEVLKILCKKNKKLTLTIAESRPQFEGRVFAKSVSKLKIKINFILEAQLPKFVEKCDAVILGADAVLKSGSVFNKIGSKTLSILCEHYNKPFYVIADRSKISKRNSIVQKAHPAKEIWNTSISNVKISNLYFEEVEGKYITEIITD